MPNRVAIVTGGSRGIGLEITRMLLKCDMDVIIGKCTESIIQLSFTVKLSSHSKSHSKYIKIIIYVLNSMPKA